MRRGSLVKTGERSYCLVGEWDSFESIAAARPQMVGVLDTFRVDLGDWAAVWVLPMRSRAAWCSS